MSELIEGDIVPITPQETQRRQYAQFPVSSRFQDDFYASKSNIVMDDPIPELSDCLAELGLRERQTRLLTPEETFDFLRKRIKTEIHQINYYDYNTRGL